MRSVLNEYNRNIGIDGQLAVEDLIDLAELILKNNYFEFEDKIYHQILGTAIGTKFALSFADIFMWKLKERMISEYHPDPLLSWRFLDDVFPIWLHEKETLLEFLNFVNGYHLCIKYTWEWSTQRLPYLDVMILVEDGRILTDVYSKPTDTHQYLHYGSCHPTHVKKGIPYGQALRMKRICSTKETYNRRIEMVRGNFEKRGFSKGFVDS